MQAIKKQFMIEITFIGNGSQENFDDQDYFCVSERPFTASILLGFETIQAEHTQNYYF